MYCTTVTDNIDPIKIPIKTPQHPLELELWVTLPYAAGASVSVLCTCPLGAGTSDRPAEERGRTGPHAQRRLPRPGGWSGAWRLCSGKTNSLTFVCVSASTTDISPEFT